MTATSSGAGVTPAIEESARGLSALADLRVVELGVWVAAPSAAGLLADWGAEVIKVEPPSGDPMRKAFSSIGVGRRFPHPALALDNRSKRSVVLDLRESRDRERFEGLLADADVLVTNLRPGALDSMDLEPAATVARHPRLVYCSISGFGLRGTERNRPSYDLGAFWARTGLSAQMAGGDGSPLNPRGGIGDHITALAALSGILAAVLEQRRTGQGQVVESSLLRTGAFVLGWDLGIQLALGKVAGPEPRHVNQTPLMNTYRTQDGHWIFFTALEVDRHIPGILEALGRPELLSDPRFADARALRRHREEVIAVLDEIVGERTLGEWAETFEAAGVWWAPVRSPADVVSDQQLIDNDGFVNVRCPGGEVVRAVNGPISFSKLPHPELTSCPDLGEHTDEVLNELDRRQ